jgi:hypothetical protein
MKIVAVVFMVIDHLDYFWFQRSFPLMMLVGRGTFPIFCYAVAVAAQKADPATLQRYVSRLLIFGLIAEPASILTHNTSGINVIFTLALGALFIGLLPRLKDWQICACYVLSLICMLLPQTIEFGFAGVMLPSAILLVMQGRAAYLPFLILLMFGINASDLAGAMRTAPLADIAESQLTIGLGTIVFSCFALKLTESSRMPQDGRYLSRYFLYAFYPLHMLALWGVKLAFFKS